MCVNKAVNMQRGLALNGACRQLMKGGGRGCVYGRNTKEGCGKKVSELWEPMDIEDLHKLG